MGLSRLCRLRDLSQVCKFACFDLRGFRTGVVLLSRISKPAFRMARTYVKDAEDGVCHRTWDLPCTKPASKLTGTLDATRPEANWTAATLPFQAILLQRTPGTR